MAPLGGTRRTLRGVAERTPPRDAARHAAPRSEDRLRALGEQVPALPPDELRPLVHERMRRFAWRAGVRMVVALAVAYLAVQWFRPLPGATFRPAAALPAHLAGSPPSLPWPPVGSAAVTVEGTGVVRTAGSTRPVPVAGVVALLTAYVLDTDHRLGTGDGPSVAVDAPTMAALAAGQAAQQSELVVTPGQTLTERQVLEGLLVAGAGDMATLAADWDAGSVAAFVPKANAAARGLGMTATVVTDPSGAAPTTVSTPADLVRLGEAVLRRPDLAAIVAEGEVTLPGGGTVFNPDGLVGHDGFVGLKTGADAAAGGCFLFAADGPPPAGSSGRGQLTVVGAVVGQSGVSDLDAALAAARPLAAAALGGVRTATVVRTGQQLGWVTTPWGTRMAVLAPRSLVVTGWPGEPLSVQLAIGHLPSSIRRGAVLGTLSVATATRHQRLVLRAPRALSPPGAGWRLGRL